MGGGVLTPERRGAPRRVPGTHEPIARMRIRTGRELTVVNVSNSGALVESTTRLLPGTHIDVHVMTPSGRVLIRSRVARAAVAALSAETVVYRGALTFERAVETAAAGYRLPGGSGS